MRLIRRIRRALRGDISPQVILLETGRRAKVSLDKRRERAMLARLNTRPARLIPQYAGLDDQALLEHFRGRSEPSFPAGFETSADALARVYCEHFPAEAQRLIESAARIVEERCWALLGYGERCFGQIDWRRDPLSGARWPLDYHRDIHYARGDGSDVRVLWELNRLAHLITLGRAYALTRDERLSAEFFRQVESWRAENPVGRGPNWSCAMEVALRAINLLAAFRLFRGSAELDAGRLRMMLALFDAHGNHIRRNLEFSYLATSNHYLSDIAGLLWLGVTLPELAAAGRWRDFAAREMLREMDKQTLADGADCESSTGYHRLVLELFLYSFILCRANGISIPAKYWDRLRAMLDYARAYLRPDGRAPLIGDSDSGQVLPISRRAADDHAYVLAIGAAVFNEPRFKLTNNAPEELFWLLGEDGLRAYANLRAESALQVSAAFVEAGTYIMRKGDQYLLFNASGAGLNGRGSHGHNDALSLEVSAGGRAFLIDPGTYVYTADLDERHRFRSTAAHSTVEVDGVEQNTTERQTPFVIGDEARPRVLRWETGPERDLVVAEHDGYMRLSAPVRHRRAVLFEKQRGYWLVEDALLGAGEHRFCFRFHAAPGLEARARAGGLVELRDPVKGIRLIIAALDLREVPALEPRWASRDYGAKEPTTSVCWTARACAPLIVRWALVPIGEGADADERLNLIDRLREEGFSFI
jgi:hypothetical protein